MDHAIASLSGSLSKMNASNFDWKLIIEAVGAAGTFTAALFAGLTLHRSNEQLKVEQTPYIVLDHIRRVGDRFGFAVKNIEIMDMTGRLLNKQDTKETGIFQIDISDINAGIYLLKLIGVNGKIELRRFVIGS